MERETSLIRHLARAMIRCGRESKRRSIAGTQYVHRCRTTCDGSWRRSTGPTSWRYRR
jgi:hypothetical protein